jgi:hypothetical protein
MMPFSSSSSVNAFTSSAARASVVTFIKPTNTAAQVVACIIARSFMKTPQTQTAHSKLVSYILISEKKAL